MNSRLRNSSRFRNQLSPMLGQGVLRGSEISKNFLRRNPKEWETFRNFQLDPPGFPTKTNLNSERNNGLTIHPNSDWGTESEDSDDYPGQTEKEKTESSLEKAGLIIQQLGESWNSEFINQIGPVKSQFKDIDHRAQGLISSEAALVKALSHQVETSNSNDQETVNQITEDFGKSLEMAVKMKSAMHGMQRKLRVLNERLNRNKRDFTNELAALKTKHQQEIENFKAEFLQEMERVPHEIQAAKSTKSEQKYVPNLTF